MYIQHFETVERVDLGETDKISFISSCSKAISSSLHTYFRPKITAMEIRAAAE